MNTIPIAFIQNLNAPEIILIFLIVLLLFGAKRLPELFRSFGKSNREYKKATTENEQDVRTAMEEEPEPSPKPKAETTTVDSTVANEETKA
ncbi:MAG: twin-arginine translocase TatA/TatE family subunit [Verrucomicrobiota bacterium]